MFAKFKRWEIMRCMVKLNNLEEQAEPPSGRTPGASTLAPPKDATMDLDEDDGLQEEANAMTQFSLGEANYGLV